MPNEWGVATVGVAGAVIGGFVGGVTPYLVAWYFRPELTIDYQETKENIVTVENTSKDGKTRTDIWVRARVQNKGRLRAKGCQVFLTSLHEYATQQIEPYGSPCPFHGMSWFGEPFRRCPPAALSRGPGLALGKVGLHAEICAWQVQRLLQINRRRFHVMSWNSYYRLWGEGDCTHLRQIVAHLKGAQ